MEENKDAKQIISQLLENHHTSVSMIAHEIRNPLTLVSSALQVIEAQHPEVRKFHNWEQMMEDVQFMCSLLTELSTFNNSSTLHHSVFSIERLLKREKGLISLTAGRREDRIIIQCRDNGCGISEDIMDTIFDPFVTSKENGTGLGLSSSKQTIEAHGGTIEAESSPKTGTVFTVTLPV